MDFEGRWDTVSRNKLEARLEEGVGSQVGIGNRHRDQSEGVVIASKWGSAEVSQKFRLMALDLISY